MWIQTELFDILDLLPTTDWKEPWEQDVISYSSKTVLSLA